MVAYHFDSVFKYGHGLSHRQILIDRIKMSHFSSKTLFFNLCLPPHGTFTTIVITQNFYNNYQFTSLLFVPSTLCTTFLTQLLYISFDW